MDLVRRGLRHGRPPARCALTLVGALSWPPNVPKSIMSPAAWRTGVPEIGPATSCTKPPRQLPRAAPRCPRALLVAKRGPGPGRAIRVLQHDVIMRSVGQRAARRRGDTHDAGVNFSERSPRQQITPRVRPNRTRPEPHGSFPPPVHTSQHNRRERRLGNGCCDTAILPVHFQLVGRGVLGHSMPGVASRQVCASPRWTAASGLAKRPWAPPFGDDPQYLGGRVASGSSLNRML